MQCVADLKAKKQTASSMNLVSVVSIDIYCTLHIPSCIINIFYASSYTTEKDN